MSSRSRRRTAAAARTSSTGCSVDRCFGLSRSSKTVSLDDVELAEELAARSSRDA